MSVHKIQVLNKAPGQITTGRNTVVLIDGQPLKGCRSFKYEVDAQGIGQVSIVLLADVTIEAELPSEQVEQKTE